MIEVPAAFVASTVAREGVAGERWLAALPGLVGDVCTRWALDVVGPVWHGYVAVAVPVRRGREELVLKVSWIDRSSEQEALVLRCWDGRGAVRLVDADEGSGALLLERLDERKSLMDVPVEEAARTAGVLLRRLAVPAPPVLRSLREEVAELAAVLPDRWAELGRPFSRRLLDATVAMIRDRTGADPRLVVNVDLHYGNVLAGGREPWLVIDPKALSGDPTYGVAQLLWTRFEELEDHLALERRLRVVCEAAELDCEAARSWTLVRVVDYWIWALGEGFTEDPMRCRTLVEWLGFGDGA